MRLDHFVFHADDDPSRLRALQQTVAPLGFPFEPAKGKGTKGFQAANLWVGEQYFEIVWLKRPDGGGWRGPWVERYRQGQRGLVAIFLLTEELDRVHQGLCERGVPTEGPERVTFRFLFGLLSRTMPWRSVVTPPIPGTEVQVCFIEHDGPMVLPAFQRIMRPNSSEEGITGIAEATIHAPASAEVAPHFLRLFPEATREGDLLVHVMGETRLSVRSGDRREARIDLVASTTRADRAGKSFDFENARVTTALPRGGA